MSTATEWRPPPRYQRPSDEAPRAEVARVRLHHVSGRLIRGQGPSRVRAHARRETDRPQTRHPQVRSATYQDQEDIRRRSRAGHLRRGGQGVLLAVRRGRGRGHADGPADEAAPRLWLCDVPLGGGGGARVRHSLPHDQEQEGGVQARAAQGSGRGGPAGARKAAGGARGAWPAVRGAALVPVRALRAALRPRAGAACPRAPRTPAAVRRRLFAGRGGHVLVPGRGLERHVPPADVHLTPRS